MQNIEDLKKSTNEKEEKSAKEIEKSSFFKQITEKLKQKDEREVRERLSKVVGFFGLASVAFLTSGSKLFFGTFPVSLALACSEKRTLFPIFAGLMLSVIVGDLPMLYGYGCLVILLVRALAVLFPAVFGSFKKSGIGEARELIEYNPQAVILADRQGEEKSSEEVSEEDGLLAGTLSRMFCEELHIKTLCGAVGGLLCGLFLLAESGFSFYSLCATLLLTLGTPILTLLLCGFFGKWEDKHKWFGFLSTSVLMLLCVYASADKTILGMPMAPFLALLLTLYASSDKGILWGAVAAVACGVGFELVYIPLLLLAAILFCLISAIRKNVGIAVVCALIVVWCYYIGGESGLVKVLPPMLLAIPFYMLADKYREMMKAPYRRMAELSEGLYFAEAVTEKTKNEAVRERLNTLSETFSSLSETIYKLSNRFRRPDLLGIRSITDETFERVCEGCRNKERCWGVEYSEIMETIGRVNSSLHKKGVLEKGDLPEGFASKCIRCEKMIEEVNAAVSRATEKVIKGGEADFFASNYEDITAILKDALRCDAEEYECDVEAGAKICEYLYAQGFNVGGVAVYGKRCKHVVGRELSLRGEISAEKNREIGKRIGEIVGAEMTEPVVEVGKDGNMLLLHSRPKIRAGCAHGRLSGAGQEWSSREGKEELFVDPFEQEDACGDTTEAFITDSSYFYALISDGMGSGTRAAYTSSVCAMFIEKMLLAGNRADITLRMLNRVIRSENMGCGEECSATVDLLELDLMSGVASFIKSGAAPTYIAREDTVYKISSRTMPVGIIKDADARITKFDTKKGDLIVMISDGCCPDSEDCPWLVEYLCAYMSGRKKAVEVGEDLCEKMKEDIIREAVRNSPEGKDRDDISVAVIRVG